MTLALPKVRIGEKLYGWNDCTKSFGQGPNNSQYYKTHTGVAPHVCNECRHRQFIHWINSIHIKNIGTPSASITLTHLREFIMGNGSGIYFSYKFHWCNIKKFQRWETSEFGNVFCCSSNLLTIREFFLLRGNPNHGANEYTGNKAQEMWRNPFIYVNKWFSLPVHRKDWEISLTVRILRIFVSWSPS